MGSKVTLTRIVLFGTVTCCEFGCQPELGAETTKVCVPTVVLMMAGVTTGCTVPSRVMVAPLGKEVTFIFCPKADCPTTSNINAPNIILTFIYFSFLF
jgi:hypothetical protein